MTVVVDKNLDADTLKELLPELIRTLKMHSEVFRNVRFNLTYWEQEGIKNQVCPMQMVMTSGFYEGYEQKVEEKHFEDLVEYLKKFQARSKLIILLTDGTYKIDDLASIKQKMQPFLEKKLLRISGKFPELEIL